MHPCLANLGEWIHICLTPNVAKYNRQNHHMEDDDMISWDVWTYHEMYVNTYYFSKYKYEMEYEEK